jgi:lysophospholipase L1-like esterase
MFTRPLAAVLLLTALSPLSFAADASAQRPLPKRIVFLGDSITYAGQYVEFVETYFRLKSPGRDLEILDIGLPSETVSGLSEEGHAGGKFPRPDLHERLERVLSKAKPDLVVACYGMNCGIYLPFAEDRFAKYRDGMERLRKACAAHGAKVLHVTPPVFDEVKGGKPGYTDTLARYSAWLLSQPKAGWDVVDVNGPMTRHLAEQRAKDPKFFLAGDGVHCNEAGHWLIAKEILLHFGAKGITAAPDPKAMLSAFPNGDAVLKLVQQRQRLLKDAWLTETKHTRPGMKTGLPLAEAQAKAVELQKQISELTKTNP